MHGINADLQSMMVGFQYFTFVLLLALIAGTNAVTVDSFLSEWVNGTETVHNFTTASSEDNNVTDVTRETTTWAIPATLVPAKPAEHRRCQCWLRAANPRTDWTFLKEDLANVLDSNAVAANVNIGFNQKPVMCSEAASECSSHCKFIGMKFFRGGFRSPLAMRRNPVSVGDYVCQFLKWNKKNVKVEVTSEADCGGLRGSSRSVRRKSAFTLINNLCCQRSTSSWDWVGQQCSLDVIG